MKPKHSANVAFSIAVFRWSMFHSEFEISLKQYNQSHKSSWKALDSPSVLSRNEKGGYNTISYLSLRYCFKKCYLSNLKIFNIRYLKEALTLHVMLF